MKRAQTLLEKVGAVRRDGSEWIHEAEPEAQEAAQRELALEIGDEAAELAIRHAIDATRVETPPKRHD